MSATPRDLLKTREQRLWEVHQLLYEKAGQANSQCVTFGGDLGVNATTTKFDVLPYAIALGQQSYINMAGILANIVPAGANPGAGQAVKVLLEVDGAGTLTQTVGAIVTGVLATAVVPAPNTGRIVIGYLGLTGAFTPGTTALTTAMLFKQPYWSWSANTNAWQGY